MSAFKWGLLSGVGALFISLTLGILSGVDAFHIFIRALIFTIVFFGIGFGLRFVINGFFPELLFSEAESAAQETEQADSSVNITLDSMGEYAVPELYNLGDSGELGNIDDLLSGNFAAAQGRTREQKANAGIDRNKEASYNDFGTRQSAFAAKLPVPEVDNISSGGSDSNDEAVFKPMEPQNYQSFTPSFGDNMGLNSLPDLDMMAKAFSSPSAGGAVNAGSFTESAGMPLMDLPSLEPAGITSSSSPVFEFGDVEQSRNTGNKPQAMNSEWDAKGLAEGIRTVLSKER